MMDAEIGLRISVSSLAERATAMGSDELCQATPFSTARRNLAHRKRQGRYCWMAVVAVEMVEPVETFWVAISSR